MKKALFILLFLLIGCKAPEPCENKTIIINQTVVVTITEPCDLTSECPECPECEKCQYDTNYVLELIRRLKKFEAQQTECFSDSECLSSLNRTGLELEDCKEELCGYNSSWC